MRKLWIITVFLMIKRRMPTKTIDMKILTNLKQTITNPIFTKLTNLPSKITNLNHTKIKNLMKRRIPTTNLTRRKIPTTNLMKKKDTYKKPDEQDTYKKPDEQDTHKEKKLGAHKHDKDDHYDDAKKYSLDFEDDFDYFSNTKGRRH